jgi:hypothetical protein
MAKLQSGNLAGGITHTFEFTYEDLQNPGFLSTSGALTGLSSNPTQTFGASNQKIIGYIPRGGQCQIAGITTVEASAGASDLQIHCGAEDITAGSIGSLTTSTSELFTDGDWDSRGAGYSVIVNNGTAFKQNVASLLTGASDGLDSLSGDSAGDAAATILYNNRNDIAQERSYAFYAPASNSADLIYFQVAGTISGLTAGRWVIYLQIFDTLSLSDSDNKPLDINL